MATLIPDEIVDLFAIVGTHQELVAKATAKYEGLAKSLSLFMPKDTAPGPLGEIIQDL